MSRELSSNSDTEAMPREWFCLRAQTKREHIAAAMLRRLDDVEPFCPRISKVKKTRTGKKRFTEAMFPGYLFARFVFRDNFRRVIHTQGVTRLIEHAGRRAVPEPVIEDLRASVPDGVIDAPDPSMEPGAEVEVVSGSLKGLNAKVIAALPAQDRVKILLDFLGREITVAVSAGDVLLSRGES